MLRDIESQFGGYLLLSIVHKNQAGDTTATSCCIPLNRKGKINHENRLVFK
jgi:hypothetical protein